MSRFSFTLQARPVALKRAVDGLEKKRREWKEEAFSFQGFVTELPKIPKDKLRKMKLRKSAQELLPYVLVEEDLDSSVMDALFVLIESKCEQFSQKTRNRIFAYGLSYPQIRKIGYQYYQENPPDESAPRWIALFWKQILRPADPVERISMIGFEHRVPITELVDWFEINPYVLWIDDLFHAYIGRHQNEWLRDCSFWEVHAFIHSSAPKTVRSSVLVWVLNSYVRDWTDWNEVPEPYRMLIGTAVDLWGEPYRSFWKECSTRVCTVGTWSVESLG